MSTIGSVENETAVRTARREGNEELATTIIETLAAAEGVDPSTSTSVSGTSSTRTR